MRGKSAVLWLGVAFILGCLALLTLFLGLSVWWPRVAVPAPTATETPATQLAHITPSATPTPYSLNPQDTATPAPTPTPTIHLVQIILPTPKPADTATPEPTPLPASVPQPISAPPPSECRGLVTRSGDQLMLDGKPFQFLGTNAAPLLEVYFPEREIEPILAFIGETFPNAVLRVWLLPGFDLERFERVLDLGKKHGVRFVVTLEDYYREKSESWFQSTFRMEYLPHVKQVVGRFRDRPEIIMWELMNEPNCGREGDTQSCLEAELGWAKETSEAIKALDPCRPVSVGTIGVTWWSSGQVDTFRLMHALPSVDIVSVHKQVGSAESDTIRIVRELGKPFFVGEVYYRVYDDGCQPIRSELLDQRADAVAADIRSNLDERASGYLLWQYAAGAIKRDDGAIQWFCGWYEYFRDDPTHKRIREADWNLDGG